MSNDTWGFTMGDPPSFLDKDVAASHAASLQRGKQGSAEHFVQVQEGISSVKQIHKCITYAGTKYIKVCMASEEELPTRQFRREAAFSVNQGSHRRREGLAFDKPDYWFHKELKPDDFLFGTPTILGQEVCWCSVQQIVKILISYVPELFRFLDVLKEAGKEVQFMDPGNEDRILLILMTLLKTRTPRLRANNYNAGKYKHKRLGTKDRFPEGNCRLFNPLCAQEQLSFLIEMNKNTKEMIRKPEYHVIISGTQCIPIFQWNTWDNRNIDGQTAELILLRIDLLCAHFDPAVVEAYLTWEVEFDDESRMARDAFLGPAAGSASAAWYQSIRDMFEKRRHMVSKEMYPGLVYRLNKLGFLDVPYKDNSLIKPAFLPEDSGMVVQPAVLQAAANVFHLLEKLFRKVDPGPELHRETEMFCVGPEHFPFQGMHELAFWKPRVQESPIRHHDQRIGFHLIYPYSSVSMADRRIQQVDSGALKFEYGCWLNLNQASGILEDLSFLAEWAVKGNEKPFAHTSPKAASLDALPQTGNMQKVMAEVEYSQTQCISKDLDGSELVICENEEAQMELLRRIRLDRGDDDMSDTLSSIGDDLTVIQSFAGDDIACVHSLTSDSVQQDACGTGWNAFRLRRTHLTGTFESWCHACVHDRMRLKVTVIDMEISGQEKGIWTELGFEKFILDANLANIKCRKDVDLFGSYVALIEFRELTYGKCFKTYPICMFQYTRDPQIAFFCAKVPASAWELITERCGDLRYSFDNPDLLAKTDNNCVHPMYNHFLRTLTKCEQVVLYRTVKHIEKIYCVCVADLTEITKKANAIQNSATARRNHSRKSAKQARQEKTGILTMQKLQREQPDGVFTVGRDGAVYHLQKSKSAKADLNTVAEEESLPAPPRSHVEEPESLREEKVPKSSILEEVNAR
ncbi:MAG: hypothetical protein CMH98_01030, partial [Oceanospirillaceae bacterium]|nr:hypothetical protein [Oceanospirillaceae bacterium]